MVKDHAPKIFLRLNRNYSILVQQAPEGSDNMPSTGFGLFNPALVYTVSVHKNTLKPKMELTVG